MIGLTYLPMAFPVFTVASWFVLSVAAMSADEWSRRSIYQILTDRFALSDGSSPDCQLRNYCGGTWQGIERKLDYISGMGFDSIWISPIVRNLEDKTTWGYGYHGYWAENPFELNAHFGTADDLRSLSRALHDRGMALMVDVNINHIALNQDRDRLDYSHLPAPLNKTSSFHPLCPIDYNDQHSVENCWLVDNQKPLLADINSENAVVFDSLIDGVATMVQQFSIDGIRLDTTRHIRQHYLSRFQNAVGCFVTGEVLSGDISYVSSYQGPLDSVLNYPLHFAATDVFTGDAGFKRLKDTLGQETLAFHNTSTLCNFLDNHDQARTASRTKADVIRDINAATFLFMTTGIPVLYYGFEQRFNGAGDPDNREAMWHSGYDEGSLLYRIISNLNKLRDLVTDSEFGTQPRYAESQILDYSQKHLVFRRGDFVVVLTSTSEALHHQSPAEISNNVKTVSEATVSVEGSGFETGMRIVDLMNCDIATTDVNGTFSSPIGVGMPRIWGPASEFCPHDTLETLKTLEMLDL